MVLYVCALVVSVSVWGFFSVYLSFPLLACLPAFSLWCLVLLEGFPSLSLVYSRSRQSQITVSRSVVDIDMISIDILRNSSISDWFFAVRSFYFRRFDALCLCIFSRNSCSHRLKPFFFTFFWIKITDILTCVTYKILLLKYVNKHYKKLFEQRERKK